MIIFFIEGFFMRKQFVLLFFLLLVLSACAARGTEPKLTEVIYFLSTAVATETPLENIPIGVEKFEGEQPTSAPVCVNSLLFLNDQTIPDGTVVVPGERLDKRWEVRNNGICNWDDRYRVKLIAGPGMGLPVQQSLYPALSNTDIVIRMVFIAPNEPGNYRSAWQAYDPQDTPFGDPFFIDIVVPEDNGE